MRLDDMLGKTTVGIEKKIKEPTIDEAKRNIAFYETFSHFRKPYSIPAMELINNSDSSIRNKPSVTQEIGINLVEERTQKIFERLNHCISSNGLIDATRLAYSFGFEIVEHKGLPYLLNGIITSNINGNQMAINDNLSKEHKRYSIAYLLSAYLLYYQKQEFFDFKHLDLEEDLEASYMARLLLIPESVLKTVGTDIEDNTQWLADMFQVPCNVMEQRIQEIKKSKCSILTKKQTPPKSIGNKQD